MSLMRIPATRAVGLARSVMGMRESVPDPALAAFKAACEAKEYRAVYKRIAKDYSGGLEWEVERHAHDHCLLKSPGSKWPGRMRIATEGVRCYVQWLQLPV